MLADARTGHTHRHADRQTYLQAMSTYTSNIRKVLDQARQFVKIVSYEPYAYPTALKGIEHTVAHSLSRLAIPVRLVRTDETNLDRLHGIPYRPHTMTLVVEEAEQIEVRYGTDRLGDLSPRDRDWVRAVGVERIRVTLVSVYQEVGMNAVVAVHLPQTLQTGVPEGQTREEADREIQDLFY